MSFFMAVTLPLALQSATIDPAALSAHTRFLSDDLLGGRDTGSWGAAVAASYIETHCRLLGLETALQPLTLADGTTLGHNVACRLRPPDIRGTVILTAHYDHLGIDQPDASGDSIYNGFSDNSAGVAMLLEIARVLAADPPRSEVQFLFFTGEERGLLGSRYYAARPVWPLSGVAGLVNLDAGAPPAPPERWELVADSSAPPLLTALAVARDSAWGVRITAPRPNSDYYPFHQVGIPTLFIIPGARPYDSLDSTASEELFRRWDAYHQPRDEWHPDFPWNGVVRYAGLALEVVRRLSQ